MKQLEFASHPGNLALVRKFVRECLTGTDLDQLESDLVVLGVDEACTNIMRHAYNEECSRPISLTFSTLGKGVRIRLRDYGQQCDPETIAGRSLEMVEPGGLGLHLIRRAFDEVNYRLMREGTELVLVKRAGARRK